MILGKIYASLKSISSYVPKDIMSNHDLAKLVDTNDEWIVQRTGIKERRIAKDEQNIDMAYKASLKAIERANLQPSQIDAVICATLSPDYFYMPSTACVLADRLGIKNQTAFDIVAACSGFLYLLDIAKSMIESGAKKNILIVGSEKVSSVLNYEDRGTCILFGDGAGASIISATDKQEEGIIDVQTGSDGNYKDILFTPLEKDHCFFNMKGNEVFKFAVRKLCQEATSILEKNNVSADEIDFFIPHQANLRIINAVKEQLKLPEEKVITVIEKYGNTSAASVPMAMNDAFESGKLKKGNLMLLNAVGGGFAWGSSLVYFNQD